jgi:hypothetical protein
MVASRCGKVAPGRRVLRFTTPKEREKRFGKLHKSVAKMNDLAVGICTQKPVPFNPERLADC